MSRHKRRKEKKRQERMNTLKVESKPTLFERDLKPRLVITEQAYKKVMFWVDLAEGEVSGRGLIEFREGVPYVIDAFLLDQECDSVSTELKAESILSLELEHGSCLWWWHSHVNMGVDWSGTDYTTMEESGRHGWMFATVFNKRRESKTMFYQGEPFKMFVNEIQTIITQDLPMEKEWREEFSAKVKNPGTKSYQTQPRSSLPEVTTVDEYREYENKAVFFTYGLTQDQLKEIEENRALGWNDYDIAYYLGMEDRLYFQNEVGGYVKEDLMEQDDIESMRNLGISDPEIQEIIEMRRGVS